MYFNLVFEFLFLFILSNNAITIEIFPQPILSIRQYYFILLYVDSSLYD